MHYNSIYPKLEFRTPESGKKSGRKIGTAGYYKGMKMPTLIQAPTGTTTQTITIIIIIITAALVVKEHLERLFVPKLRSKTTPPCASKPPSEARKRKKSNQLSTLAATLHRNFEDTRRGLGHPTRISRASCRTHRTGRVRKSHATHHEQHAGEVSFARVLLVSFARFARLRATRTFQIAENARGT